MNIIDMYDNGYVMLRMAVADGRIVGCEGPMAFIVEELNEILEGRLRPHEAAQLLDLQSDIIEHRLQSCPPLPAVAALLGNLLRHAGSSSRQPNQAKQADLLNRRRCAGRRIR